MNGKICMVTGANAGIGKEIALSLAQMGAAVVMVARSRERGEVARADIVAASGNHNVDLLLADLSAPDSIRGMVEEFRRKYDRLNVLVNNAGVFLMKRQESADGLELTFSTNHLGYFIPTLLLWDLLIAGSPARVINVSSDAHRGMKLDFNDLQNKQRYRGFRAYGQSKLANVLFTYELDRRRNGANVTINAVHPGFVASNFGRNNKGIVGWFMSHIVPHVARTAKEGAATAVYLATSPEVEGVSGKYFVDLAPRRTSPESYDLNAARQLWTVSEQLSGIETPATLATQAI